MLKYILLLSLVAYAASGLLGGFEDANVDDEDVQDAATHAAQELSKKFAGPYHHKLVKVVKAKRQVVAGTNYRLKVIVGMTTCKKSEVSYERLGDCEFKTGVSTYKKCEVVVYRDLKDSHKLITSGCILAGKNEV